MSLFVPPFFHSPICHPSIVPTYHQSPELSPPAPYSVLFLFWLFLLFLVWSSVSVLLAHRSACKPDVFTTLAWLCVLIWVLLVCAMTSIPWQSDIQLKHTSIILCLCAHLTPVSLNPWSSPGVMRRRWTQTYSSDKFLHSSCFQISLGSRVSERTRITNSKRRFFFTLHEK